MLLSALPAQGADDSATVNERIPVRKAELEAHWQLDCHTLWHGIRASMADGEHCGLSSQQRRELELCSYIYQPPGGSSAGGCPDYGAALRLVDSERTAVGCDNLAELVDKQLSCTTRGKARAQ